MKAFLLFIIGFCLFGCKSTILFQRKYYDGSKSFEFYSDNSYQYLEKMEGGYVYKFSKGTWQKEGNKLYLLNGVSSPSELPTGIRTSSSDNPETQLVINILPDKNLYFPYLPSTTDLLNIELVIDKTIYPLKNETNIIRLQKPFDRGYFRAYPKPDVERSSEILNDTLRSQYIGLKEFENKILSIDVDCNPMYFAKLKMANDTLRIISNRKIKWNKIFLERSQD
jgi:hypothetical protein